MIDLDNTQAAKLCGLIRDNLPADLDFVLVMVDAEGQIMHLSTLAPRACKVVITNLAEGWDPIQVDNIVVRS